MKKLSKEEAKNMIPMGRGRFSWLYKALLTLDNGEGLIIKNDDWKGKTSPYPTIRRVSKKYHLKFEYGRMPDGTGWLVKRIA